ncbi:MAG: glycosyltransferase [Patescibacteria group bacterium]|nr:glycosyltransferase [Patescibacteria group bacterium]
MRIKNTPSISVIILAYNAERTIRQCLHAITNQATHVAYEIIVVYRRSSDRTLEIIKQYPSVNVIIQPDNLPGISAARNLGIAKAKSSIIAFTDADCVVSSNWIQRIFDCFFRDHTVDAIGGPLVGTGNESTWIARVGGYVAELHGTIGKIATNNCAIRKSALQHIGGFDEQLMTGEDVDMSWRLEKMGVRIVIDHSLRVMHLWRHTLRDFIREQYGYGKGRGLLIDRYPEKYPIIERHAHRLFFLSILYVFITIIFLYLNTFIAVLLLIICFLFGCCIVIGRRYALSKKIIQTRGIWFFLQCVVIYFLIDIANILGIISVKLRRCRV